MSIKGFYKPELLVSVNGKALKFSKLILDSFTYGFILKIDFSENPGLSKGDILEGLFKWSNSNKDLLFTSLICEVEPNGNCFSIVGRELYYNKLNSLMDSVTWRKISVKEVLSEVFNTVEISSFNLDSCPDIELSRFSIKQALKAINVIENITEAIKIITGKECGLQPRPDGSLSYGEISHNRQIMPDIISFQSGLNIISKSGNRIKAFALPVLANQEVSIDDEIIVCKRSIITITPGKYRIEMEAA